MDGKFDYNAIGENLKIVNDAAKAKDDTSKTIKTIKIVNHQADINKVLSYINEHFKNNLDSKFVNEIAQFLLGKYALNDILEGKANVEIENQLKLKKCLANSVSANPVKEEGKSKKVDPAEIKIKVIKGLKALVVVVGAVAIIFAGGKIYSEYQDIKESEQIDISIGSLATGVEKSIVVQNTHSEYNYVLKKVIDIYDYDGIAKCIVNVCEQNPELFDLTMGEVYFDLQERLQNADQILVKLQNLLKDNEKLSALYESIKDYDVFLDYLMDKNLLNVNSEEYKELTTIVYNYKIDGYYKLSEDYQKKIDEFIKTYEAYVGNLEDLYNTTLENMNSTNQTNLQEATEEVLEVDSIETLDGGSYGK